MGTVSPHRSGGKDCNKRSRPALMSPPFFALALRPQECGRGSLKGRATNNQPETILKRQLTVRVDADVLAWLKSKGAGYHGRLNRILRSAMLRDSKS
jgi:uncharacterized protein (DUF4415 family)